MNLELDSQPPGGTAAGTAPRAARPERRTEGRRARARSRPARTAATGAALQPRPTASRRAEHRLDLDQVYLSEMAAKTTLSAADEVEIASRIVAAEHALLSAVLRSPTGADAIDELRRELEANRLDVRDVLLNPDEHGLDLDATRARLLAAFERGEAGAADLAHARLDASLVDEIATRIRSAAARGDAAEIDAAAALARAKRELARQKERLVVGNLRLVVLFARKFLGRGVPMLDLVQEGNLGLMRAADKFDHRRGFRFSTYAAWWIKQALQRGLLDRALRLPVHVADDRRRVGRVRAKFAAQHRRDPEPDEIARLSGLAPERVKNILSLPQQPASLDAPVGDAGEASLADFIPSGGPTPDELASLHALGRDLGGLLEALTAREKEVIQLRFGMGHAREHTLEEVGRMLGLTRERIRQIERGALDKLRARGERLELETYL